MKIAMGMVAATVDVAHGLCFMAFTTTRPSTAIRITMIISVPIEGSEPAERPELVARHLAETAAVPAGRQEQDDHVLHAATEDRPYEDPQRAGQVAELSGQRRADERAGAGDGGEVVAEHDPAMGRHEVAAVVEAFRRRGARGVRREHLRRDPGRIEAIAQGVDTDGCDDDPQRVDGLVSLNGDAAHGECRDDRQYDAQNSISHQTP